MSEHPDWNRIVPLLISPVSGEPLSAGPEGFVTASGDERFDFTNGVPQFLSEQTHGDIMKHFDETAERHGTGPGAVEVVPTIANALRATLEQLIPDDAIALDVGCGHGQFSKGVARQTPTLGVDISQRMLELASQAGLYPLRADGMNLPLREGSIDVAYSIEVVQLFDDPAPLLREMARVLKPGGRMVISTLHSASLLRRVNRMLRGTGRTTLRSADDLVSMIAGTTLKHTTTHYLLGPSQRVIASHETRPWFRSAATNIITVFEKAA
ncbi:MAG: class I SAM-dependent methyltransferase [Gammaproteobacteria bacterium]